MSKSFPGRTRLSDTKTFLNGLEQIGNMGDRQVGWRIRFHLFTECIATLAVENGCHSVAPNPLNGG